MTIRRCITRIEFGPKPEEFRVVLDDGSELHGITKAEAKTEWEQFATFRLEGYVMAGKGLNGEPAPIVCTHPEGD